MKNALFGLLFASTILAGCASQIMGDMVGKDVNQIVAQYGPPVNSFDLPDGRRAFQWRLDSAYVMPTTTTFTGYGNVATAFNSGGAIISNACYYTLYTKPNPQKSYTVVSFEPPRMDCE
jgi:hypothetical protein